MATLAQLRTRAQIINNELIRLFPGPLHTMLTYQDPWQLLVAVILSAQCTDRKVNEITPALFARYPTLEDFLTARAVDVEKLVYQTGFYRNKTKNILAAARVVHDRYGGQVPRTMEEMLTIPGVARKTANVVLGNAYGLVVGIAIDTHMIRLSKVLGLTRESNPVKIEQDLMKILPSEQWYDFTYRLISYGRTYCPAIRHNHQVCPLTIVLAGV